MKNEQLIRKSLTRFFLFRKQMIQIARIMAVLTLVFLVVPGFAQNQLTTINGTVVGADDGSPIPGATIVIKGTSTYCIQHRWSFYIAGKTDRCPRSFIYRIHHANHPVKRKDIGDHHHETGY
ncbi:hypothetical protein [Prolixibacter bellariivorans]|uniref:hypothetical protein n=1 Tax=Prolixibacter bellariivorans TaxID=314319 RepID=UPI001900B0ED|nr:hypothetical protein [Prolixibacter bellariivorans]